jgi:hypothetical protein
MNEQERQPSCNAMGQRLIFSSSAAAILHCYGLAPHLQLVKLVERAPAPSAEPYSFC